jgi:hypothetical protein
MQALVLGLVCLLFVGCGAATPQLIQCKLDALKVLPDDPKMVTPYDGEDLINRLHACERDAADGGTP